MIMNRTMTNFTAISAPRKARQLEPKFLAPVAELRHNCRKLAHHAELSVVLPNFGSRAAWQPEPRFSARAFRDADTAAKIFTVRCFLQSNASLISLFSFSNNVVPVRSVDRNRYRNRNRNRNNVTWNRNEKSV